MEKANSRYFVVGAIVTIMVAIIGVTYAYWRGQIQGEGSNVKVTFDKVYIQFTDSTQLAETGVKPGWSTSKTFTIENQGNIEFKYDIYIKDLINTLVTEGYFQYKISSTNDGYNMEDYAPIPKSPEASDYDLGTNISIAAGVTQTYTIEFRYVDDPSVDQSEDMGKRFGGVLAIRENNSKTLYSTLTNGSIYEIGERTDFSTPFGGETIQDGYNQTGKIYKADNDYYFAGNPSDNWVKFADKWWRIIRTNSTEGTRLLYAGTSTDSTTAYISGTSGGNVTREGYYRWYGAYDNANYVQWNYTKQTVSSGSCIVTNPLGTALSNWYTDNITGTNDEMVNSIVYCNDTSQTSTSGSDIYYGAYNRLVNAKAPNNACGSNSFGSASKVGLMTADEVAYAGEVYGNNAPNTYYYRNSKTSGCTGESGDPCSVTGDQHWWTLSPYNFYSGLAVVFFVCSANGNHPGSLNYNNVTASYAVRPVITLKPTVLVSGSGTTNDPYIVVGKQENSDGKYNVTLNAYNATISGNTTQEVEKNGSVTFTVTPNETYKLSKVTCNNGAEGTISNNTVTISKVTDDNICEVEVIKKTYTITVTSNNNNYGTVSPTSQSVIHGNSATITLNPKTNYKYSSNTCNATVVGNTMTISNITAAKTCSVKFIPTQANGETLYTYLSNGAAYEIGTRTNFSTPVGGTTITQGYNSTGRIYKTGNDYYFAGNPSDNWVKFAGFWWRIIRTNSTEGTRLLYAGTSHDGQDGFISGTNIGSEGLYKWNDSSYSQSFVEMSNASFAAGYPNDILTSWYKSNITGTNVKMVNTNIAYCNDISTSNTSKPYYYGAYDRLKTNKVPSYACGTNSNSTHKSIGLMTADEVAFAGGVFDSNSPNTYYYRNSKINGCTGTSGDSCSVTGYRDWWTMSPYNYNGTAYVFFVHGANTGGLGYNPVTSSMAIRPVITLKSDVKVSGSGTTDNPFVPVTSLYETLSNGSKYSVSTKNSFSSPEGGTSITQGYNSTGKIYKTGNDYYFSGNPSDNWVKFAGFWWRIIRSNSTEGTRLLYAGTSHDGQEGYINDTTYQWRASYSSASYVEWKNASFRYTLTDWYDSNITGTNANMINSVLYCNDTSVASTNGSNQYFGAYGRLYTNKTPSHACETNGNATQRSVGLMTADEVAYAGGVYNNKSPNTYYYRNSKTSGCTGASGDPCSVTGDNYWWTMSPARFYNDHAYMFIVYGASSNAGFFSDTYVTAMDVVRPVITLKPEVKVSGSGTTTDPYIPSVTN